ncbi:ATP-binding protein [Nonomuraea sp. NPDC050663]|uniref:ATP-binding protein n=1 Tax=Nonomuraea sp. NPDC050663 TaxID=3364370 RepID=UPI0037AD7BC2
MRVAFVGKGGSGKTTISALFARYAASQGAPVVAIDADINQHLALVLGLDEQPEPLGAHLEEIKELLRGSNPLIPSAAAMTKTTPPGRGSRLLPLDALPYTVATPHGLRLMATGPFAEEDLGVACYHSKVGAAELLLNHLVDEQGEYVVVDMTAGADSFASGLFTRFDLTVLVAEPTRQGVSVFQQYRDYASAYDVSLAVVGNKIHSPDDVDFLRAHVGDSLLTWFEHSSAVRALEQGRPFDLIDLEPANTEALSRVLKQVDAQEKNWERYGRQTAQFHERNAEAWGNSRAGTDLSLQIDPGFVYGRLG